MTQTSSIAATFSTRPAPPRRFIVTVFVLYALFMTVLLSAGISVTTQNADGPVFSAALCGAGFWLFATAFGLMLAPRRLSIAPLAICAAGSFFLSAILCLVAAWGGAHGASAADPQSLPPILRFMARFGQLAEQTTEFWPALIGHALGGALFEEGYKFLLPAQLLLMGRLNSGRMAMFCGALAGLMFGLLEADSFAAFNYSIHPTAAYNHLIRFLVMAPEHAMWTAIVSGMSFLLWKRSAQAPAKRPPLWALIVALLMGVFLHGLHNALLTSFGPRSVGPAFLASLLIFYAVARAVWERDQLDAQQTSLRLSPISFVRAQMFVVVIALLLSLTTAALWPLYQTMAWRLRRTDTSASSTIRIVAPMAGSGTIVEAASGSAGMLWPKFAASALKSSVSTLPS